MNPFFITNALPIIDSSTLHHTPGKFHVDIWKKSWELMTNILHLIVRYEVRSNLFLELWIPGTMNVTSKQDNYHTGISNAKRYHKLIILIPV